MPSSTSSFERSIPALPWRSVLIAVLVLSVAATAAWEITCRRWGYAATINDTADLWAQQREKLRPDSVVIVGDSRPLFDLDLDVLETSLGQRPLQLALAGSCGYPILADLADQEDFRGTVLCSLVPGMWLAPGGPLVETSQKALQRYRTWTPAQRWSHHLGMFLEERLAFIQQEDLTLAMLLKRLPIPDRPNAQVGPPLPPYFHTVDRDRRTRMAEQCAMPGRLQDRVKFGWPKLFTPPPPPSYVPLEAFLRGMGAAMEARYGHTAAAVKKIQARGGKVVFVRFPHTGVVKEIEDKGTPRAATWDRFLRESCAPGIHFEDHPELASFDCPEWSHLSSPDSVEFTKRLVPHLKVALGQ